MKMKSIHYLNQLGYTHPETYKKNKNKTPQ